MKITKLGHCCLLVEIRDVRFLTDPGNYTVEQNEVKNIDYVVISHEHTDHLHIESIKIIIGNNPDVRIICNSSVGKILDREDISYTKVADKESHDCGGVTISAHGTDHAPIYREYELVENTGYLFDGKFYYPGDAFHNPNIPIDILAFPVTGPWCTIASAVDYVLDIKPRIAFPVHDGNLIKKTGITVRLPSIEFPKKDITFIALELGKETEL